MVQTLHTRYIPVEDLRRLDPDLKTFTNINQLDELDRINRCPAPDR
jgi:molybdenum cofactor guanylyltransferase